MTEKELIKLVPESFEASFYCLKTLVDEKSQIHGEIKKRDF